MQAKNDFSTKSQRGKKSAVTEMVPDLIWAPDFSGSREIWSSRNLDPEIFGPHERWFLHENTIMIFMHGPNFSEHHGVQIFLGTKNVRGPNEIGDHLS